MGFDRRLMSAALALSAMLLSQPALAEDGFFTREQVIRHTPAWTGERFPDGRPKVPDDILERMGEVTLEEAWVTRRSAGFNHHYEDGWLSIFPGKVLVGRALASQCLHGRPASQGAVAAWEGVGWEKRLAT